MKKIILGLLLVTTMWGQGIIPPRALSSGGASNGQVLKWNGTIWAPASDSTSGGSVAGPGSSTDGYVPQWSGTGGATLSTGLSAVSTNTVSTLVKRDSSGNFSAGTITATLSGNATTATALAANPAACSAGQYVSDIAANGTLTCGTPAGTGAFVEDGFTSSAIPKLGGSSGSATLVPTFITCTTSPQVCTFYDSTASTGESQFTIRNGAGQARAPLKVLANNGSTTYFQVSLAGNTLVSSKVSIGNTTDPSNTLYVYDSTASTGVSSILLKAGAGQSTTKLMSWQNNAGTVLGYIDSSGNVASGNFTGIQASGTAGYALRCQGGYNTTAVGCYMDFYHLDGTTRAGLIGYSSTSNNNLLLYNEKNSDMTFYNNAALNLTLNGTRATFAEPVAASDPSASGDLTTRGSTWTDTHCIKLSSSKLITAGGTCVVADSTDTLTNKTLNAESTGNVITIPFIVQPPLALCNNVTAVLLVSTPATNPGVATCVTGTNTQQGVIAFADAGNDLSIQGHFTLSSDWTGNIDWYGKWNTSATSGNAVWQLQTTCVADAETGDPAFNTASTVTDAAKGTTLQLNDTSISAVTITGCAAGEEFYWKLHRDPAHASDTLGATANLYSMYFITRRAM